MRRTLLAVIIATFEVSVAVATPIHPLQRDARVVDRTTHEARVLRDAFRMFVTTNGDRWAMHHVATRREPSAIGMTRLKSDGTTQLYLASDFLPRGTIPLGTVGQVYSIGEMATPGSYAVAIGWVDASNHSTNAAKSSSFLRWELHARGVTRELPSRGSRNAS